MIPNEDMMPIIPPDLREKPRRPVNSFVDAVEKPLTKNRNRDEQKSTSQNALYSTIMGWGWVK